MCPSPPWFCQSGKTVVGGSDNSPKWLLSHCYGYMPWDVWDVCWTSRAGNHLNFLWLGELWGEWSQLKDTQTRNWGWGSAYSCPRNLELCLLEAGTHVALVGLELIMQQRWLGTPWPPPPCLYLLSAQMIGMYYLPSFLLVLQTEPRVSCTLAEHYTTSTPQLEFLEKASSTGWEDQLPQGVWGCAWGTRGGQKGEPSQEQPGRRTVSRSVQTRADVWLVLQWDCQWAWLTAWAGAGSRQMIPRNCSLESYGFEIGFKIAVQWSRNRFSQGSITQWKGLRDIILGIPNNDWVFRLPQAPYIAS